MSYVVQSLIVDYKNHPSDLTATCAYTLYLANIELLRYSKADLAIKKNLRIYLKRGKEIDVLDKEPRIVLTFASTLLCAASRKYLGCSNTLKDLLSLKKSKSE